MELLRAVTARILPSQDGPGARETGVAEYIAGALEDPFYEKLRGPVAMGLRVVEGAARDRHGHSFSNCDEIQQDELLAALQDREFDTPEFPAHFFFEILITFALEGFLCDPKYGGNRNGIGWRFLGADPRPLDIPRCMGGEAVP